MKKIIIICLFVAINLLPSCKEQNPYTGDCFVPDAAVNITLNMELPEYYNLRNLGEYISIEQGNRGVYVIHNYDDIYYAIERTCTYRSEDDCSQIQIDESVLQLRCGQIADTGFVQCCASTYSFNSAFLSGPTQCNLKTYRVNQSGNSLYISN